jgi:MarR family transcriptional regulator, 2-MHQ and catechol-resistance regulon repressor
MHARLVSTVDCFKFKLLKLINGKTYGKKEDLALNLWVKLARATASFAKMSTENIRLFGLTEPQFSALECLGHLGPLKLGDLSRKMLVSGGNITCVVDNLEKRDLVKRSRSLEDKRAMYVQLTPDGKKMFDEIFVHHAEFIRRTASVLSEKEQSTLAALLKKLGLGLQSRLVSHH